MTKLWVEWTTTEIRILKEIWADQRPIKTNADRLPRHGLRAILVKGQSLKLPPRLSVKSEYSAAFAVLKQALEQTPDHAKNLVLRTGISRRHVTDFLKLMHSDGRTHITGWRKTARNGPPFPIYAWGEGDDVPKPEPAAVRNKIRRKDLPRAGVNPFRQMVASARNNEMEAA